MEKGEAHLRLRCAKCHQWSDIHEGESPDDLVGPVKTISGTNDVFAKSWLKRGRFDHFEHRDMDCSRCHGPAGAARTGGADRYESMFNQRASEKNADVLIADHESCIQCHQPLKNVAAGNRAAAYNCTFCHTYHGGGNRSFHILNRTSK